MLANLSQVLDATVFNFSFSPSKYLYSRFSSCIHDAFIANKVLSSVSPRKQTLGGPNFLSCSLFFKLSCILYLHISFLISQANLSNYAFFSWLRFGREGEREWDNTSIDGSLPKYLQWLGQGEAKTRSHELNPGCTNPITWVITSVSQGLHYQEVEVRNRARHPNSDIFIRDVRDLTVVLPLG